ncbi:uncharacterized protein LOC129983905 [Argiope bruennichi]|uniref:uncharacterized protein LOC129983905 n=1 Tax=Argiope bruennichi TaxID=94029 RepID=UPI00249473AB|nr:uncharacterized protein LOC129983905 [Argiope bruennichi]
MRFTRRGKLIFTTKDLGCTKQLLGLEQINDTKVTSNVIWEGVTSRFLLIDMLTCVPLKEVADELRQFNDIETREMRRFVKQNSTQQTSILVTILGTSLPDSVKLWLTFQKIRPFIDRPRQCSKCYNFLHLSRICSKDQVCQLCGTEHVGNCQNPVKCINCQGSHAATSKACSLYVKEQQILDLKCRNHLTTGEARRLFNALSNTTYATVATSSTEPIDFEKSLNDKMESSIQNINKKMEQHFNELLEIFQKTVESMVQQLIHVIDKGEKIKSPSRKKKALLNASKNFTSSTSQPMQWDAGGPAGTSD